MVAACTNHMIKNIVPFFGTCAFVSFHIVLIKFAIKGRAGNCTQIIGFSTGTSAVEKDVVARKIIKSSNALRASS